jgi:predicted dehydrogenase
VRLDPALDGGSIWDVGSYPISYARCVIGAEPVEVFGWQVTGPTGVDVTFVGQMRFAGDVIARFDSSFRMPDRAHIQVVGSEGIINVPDPFKPERDHKILLTRNGETETLAIPDQMLYLGEVEDMADAILLGKAPRISLADSRGNVAAIVALLRSAREDRPVLVR